MAQYMHDRGTDRLLTDIANAKPENKWGGQRFTDLFVCRLSRESRSRTCGYWFVVTSGTTSHTAFRTRRGLDLWLSRLGLELTGPLDKAGDQCRIEGEYRRVYIPAETLDRMNGEKIRTLHNGDYVDGMIVRCGGETTLYVSHPGVLKHDYRESQRMEFGEVDDNEDRACAIIAGGAA